MLDAECCCCFPKAETEKKGLVPLQGAELSGDRGGVLCERLELLELRREELASKCNLFCLKNQVCVL